LSGRYSRARVVKFFDQEGKPRMNKRKRTPGGRKAPVIDPRRILETIAADPHAASTARVSACRALLALAAVGDIVPKHHDGIDQITRAAIASMRRRGGDDE